MSTLVSDTLVSRVEPPLKWTGFPKGQPDSLYHRDSPWISRYHIQNLFQSVNIVIPAITEHWWVLIITAFGITILISEYKPAGLIAMQTESETVAKLQAGLPSGSFSSTGNLQCSTSSVVPPIVVVVILRVVPCTYPIYPQGWDRSTSPSVWSVYVDAIR